MQNDSNTTPFASPRVTAVTTVLAVAHPCDEHVHVEFTAPRDFPSSSPGQFVQILCSDDLTNSPQDDVAWSEGAFPALRGAELRARHAFTRRPFSIADRSQREDGTHAIAIISRKIGPGTAWLDRLRPGDAIDVTGPLGRPFEIPASPTPLILIGGGVGIPPLLYLARRLNDLGHRDVTVIFGALRRGLLPVSLTAEPAPDGSARSCLALPGGAPFPAILSTNDGSLGLRGLVTDGLQRWCAARSRDVPAALVFACGPEPMLHAVSNATRAAGIACQLCIERTMGCGLGTCLSCITRVTDASKPDGWRWALSCSEGPVFNRDHLIDFAAAAAPPSIGAAQPMRS